MTRRPDLARACHQLGRHGSGTPNDGPSVVTVFLESPAMIQTAQFVKAFEDAAPVVLRTLAQHMRNAGLPR